MNSIEINKLKKKTSNTNSFIEFLNKDIDLFGKKLNDKHKEFFYNELATLISAGLDIKSALDMIVSEAPSKEGKIYTELQKNIINGSSFSEAQTKCGMFSAYEYYSTQIGEETGKLTFVFQDLAKFYQNKIKQRRQIISALSYPVIVMCLSIGAVIFMLYFIVPMFSEIFKRFGGDLPAITKTILNLSRFVSNNILYLIISIALIFIGIYSQKDKIWFKKATSYLLLKLPIFGVLVQKIQIARFCSTMGLMISSKVPLVKAVSLIENVTEFYPIKKALPVIGSKLIHGVSLYECLKGDPIFDKKMVSLIKVGEEVNQLDTFFYRIADQYGEEIDHKTKIMGSLIEPFLLIFLGGIVGFILIAMYLPLFKLSTTFG